MKILGIILILIGACLGFYIGLWVCFIGGIIQVIEQIRVEHLEASIVAWGIAKVIFAGFFGWLSGLIFILPGYAILND